MTPNPASVSALLASRDSSKTGRNAERKQNHLEKGGFAFFSHFGAYSASCTARRPQRRIALRPNPPYSVSCTTRSSPRSMAPGRNAKQGKTDCPFSLVSRSRSMQTGKTSHGVFPVCMYFHDLFTFENRKRAFSMLGRARHSRRTTKTRPSGRDFGVRRPSVPLTTSLTPRSVFLRPLAAAQHKKSAIFGGFFLLGGILAYYRPANPPMRQLRFNCRHVDSSFPPIIINAHHPTLAVTMPPRTRSGTTTKSTNRSRVRSTSPTRKRGPSNAGDQASKRQKKQPGPDEPDATQGEGTGEEEKTKKGGKRSKVRTPTMSSPPSLTDPARLQGNKHQPNPNDSAQHKGSKEEGTGQQKKKKRAKKARYAPPNMSLPLSLTLIPPSSQENKCSEGC